MSQNLNLSEEQAQKLRLKIADRHLSLQLYYEMFIDDYDQTVSENVFLSTDLLFDVVKSYFDDIIRYKSYSGAEYADRHKQSAYMMKWLSKIKPIQVKSNISLNEDILKINYYFAVFSGLTFLHEDVRNNLTSSFLDHLVYTLHYRNISGRQFAGSMYLLEQACMTEESKAELEETSKDKKSPGIIPGLDKILKKFSKKSS